MAAIDWGEVSVEDDSSFFNYSQSEKNFVRRQEFEIFKEMKGTLEKWHA